MIADWETLEKKFIKDLKIFDLYHVKRKHPEWNKEGQFVLLDSPSWVNIIPITAEKKVVLVEQYRHGIDKVTLEIPGGLVERGEDPREAGQRECLEETGFSGPEKSLLLGDNYPNPAFLNNKCWSYVWHNCSKTSDQKLDGNEDINVKEVSFDEIKRMIRSGEIKHSLVLTAFFFYFMDQGF